MIEDIAFDALPGGKAFDHDWLAGLDKHGASAIIRPEGDRTRPVSCGFEMCKWHPLAENFCCNLKKIRYIATR